MQQQWLYWLDGSLSHVLCPCSLPIVSLLQSPVLQQLRCVTTAHYCHADPRPGKEGDEAT